MAAIAALVLLALASPLLAQENGRKRIEGSQFVVRYRPGDEREAYAAADAAEQALLRLSPLFGVERLSHRLTIELARNRAEFDALAGKTTHPFTEGQVRALSYRVLLRGVGRLNMERLVTHELVHVLLDERLLVGAGVRAPRWLHEGLAKYLTDDLSPSDRQTLGEAIAGRRLLGIQDLDRAFAGDSARTSLAYAQSYTLVEFLLERTGGPSLPWLLETIAREGSVQGGIRSAYGVTLMSLETEWLGQVRATYLSAALPVPTELLILLALGGLATVALAARALRRRARRRHRTEQTPGEQKNLSWPQADPNDRGEEGDQLWYT